MKDDFDLNKFFGGSGKGPRSNKLRDLLANIGHPEEDMTNNILYKEGYEDGVRDAHEKFQKLFTALSTVYSIEPNEGRP